MPNLDTHYIQEIHKWIKSLNINYYDVELELVDHIASGVEKELENNNPPQTIDLVVSELKKWPVAKINTLIKEKKHHLYWSWQKKLWDYLVGYFKLPKVLILLALTSCFSITLLNTQNPNQIIDYGIKTTTLLYVIWLMHTWFFSYKKGNGDVMLISSEAYHKTIGGIPALPYLLFVMHGKFNQIEVTMPNIVLFSFLISICIILVHAFLFVFPKQLKKDTVAYYDHLNTHYLGIKTV